MKQQVTAILPCNDLESAQAFFARLGFQPEQGSIEDYRMLSDGKGGFIHLTRAVEGWLQAGRNPFGLYLYREDVDGAAASFPGEILGEPCDTPWGMYEFRSTAQMRLWFVWDGRRGYVCLTCRNHDRCTINFSSKIAWFLREIAPGETQAYR